MGDNDGALLSGPTATHRCLGCGCAFVEENLLRLHIKRSSQCAQANPQTFTCGKCRQQFPQLEALHQHVRRHILLDSVSSFGHGGKVNSYRQTDSRDKPHRCEHCGKSFSRKQDLRRHLHTHTGYKPYKCEHCGKCFSQSCSLKRHLWTHSVDKPYKCEHCGKCFVQSCTLQTHLQTHSKDKPFKCEFCGNCFRQKGVL